MRRLGIEPVVSDSPEVLSRADKVLFPGVGEASSAMAYLREHGLDRVIVGLTQPVLAICIGMQLLCSHSEEGDVDCLGLFDTEVRRFVSQTSEQKVPHMGGIPCAVCVALSFTASTRVAMSISCTATMSRFRPIA